MTDHQEQIIREAHVVDSTGIEFRKRCIEAVSRLSGYDWSGVYRLEGSELVLDAYVGDPTEHDRIQVGQGVCGTAVATGSNQLIDDVRVLENYLSCSVDTRSEIVVLIRDPEDPSRILGQIDIDSHAPSRFGATDEQFLESLAILMARRW